MQDAEMHESVLGKVCPTAHQDWLPLSHAVVPQKAHSSKLARTKTKNCNGHSIGEHHLHRTQQGGRTQNRMGK